jgi:hypothetical protein
MPVDNLADSDYYFLWVKRVVLVVNFSPEKENS